MSESDDKLVAELCEVGERLLGEGSDGYCKDPRTLSDDDKAELRRAAKLLFPLLKRMADDRDRAKAK